MTNSQRLIAAVASLFILFGCNAGSAAATPTASPTSSENSVAEALTVVAGLTSTPTAGAAQPTGTPVPASPTPQPPAATSRPAATSAPASAPVAPRIDSFTVSPSPVDPGVTVTLAWKTNADKASLKIIQPSEYNGP